MQTAGRRVNDDDDDDNIPRNSNTVDQLNLACSIIVTFDGQSQRGPIEHAIERFRETLGADVSIEEARRLFSWPELSRKQKAQHIEELELCVPDVKLQLWDVGRHGNFAGDQVTKHTYLSKPGHAMGPQWACNGRTCAGSKSILGCLGDWCPECFGADQPLLFFLRYAEFV